MNLRNKVPTPMETLKRTSRPDDCFDRSSAVSPFMIDSGYGVLVGVLVRGHEKFLQPATLPLGINRRISPSAFPSLTHLFDFQLECWHACHRGIYCFDELQ